MRSNNEGQEPSARDGFADGFTAFLTIAGLDVLMRTSAGESKGRLGTLDDNGNLVGSMYAPGDNEKAKPLALVATLHGETRIELRCGDRVWNLRRPEGKDHFFAFMNQWPAKAEPATSVRAMLAALKKKS
jgi:hypothetical protein